MEELRGKFISLKYRERKDDISGILIDYNENWTLLKLNPVDYIIDGYILLKSKNVIKYKRDDDELFREKVLLAKGLGVNNIDKFPIFNIYETLKLISEKFGAFQISKKDETKCYIGKLIKANKSEITIQEIDPKANWDEIEKYKFSSIRTIEFGTDYINSLILYNKLIEK